MSLIEVEVTAVFTLFLIFTHWCLYIYGNHIGFQQGHNAYIHIKYGRPGDDKESG